MALSEPPSKSSNAAYTSDVQTICVVSNAICAF